MNLCRVQKHTQYAYIWRTSSRLRNLPTKREFLPIKIWFCKTTWATTSIHQSLNQSTFLLATFAKPTFAKPALSMSHVRFCNYITEPCYIRSHRIHTRRWYARQGSTRKGCPVPTHTAVPLSAGKGITLCARVEQYEIGNCVSRVMEIHKHILDIWVFRPCSQPAPPPHRLSTFDAIV